MEAPSGLGNFKGVMLCNRPEEGPKAAEAGPQPFKSACAPTYGEQLGLNPPVREANPKKMPEMKPNESLVRHHKWLKQLQEDVTDAKVAETQGVEGEKQKKEKLKDFCERQRQAMKELRELGQDSGHEAAREGRGGSCGGAHEAEVGDDREAERGDGRGADAGASGLRRQLELR